MQRGGARASRSPRHRVGELSGGGSQRVPADMGLLGVSGGSGCLLPEPLCRHRTHTELHEHWFSNSWFCIWLVRAVAALAAGLTSWQGRPG